DYYCISYSGSNTYIF
nr:immunoglobulin light chain junction region [Macaca mulatta]